MWQLPKHGKLNINVRVAVCDEAGHLIALNRMDGTRQYAIQGSVGKAVVSAGSGLPSGDVTGVWNNSRVGLVVGEGIPAIQVRGGLPIIQEGKVDGACGVDGAPSNEQDEECARAGISGLQR